MKIWVDADACPVAIKDILFRAAERTGVQLILVANHKIRVPALKNIKFIQVQSGFDIADNEIVRQLTAGDLIITNDLPLASEAIDKGCCALSTRGDVYTSGNIKALLNMRDFMDTLRSSGINTGGPPALSQSDRKSFADSLDKILTKALKKT
jgi:uncharacterized protein YaiI (UPF0178 family)